VNYLSAQMYKSNATIVPSPGDDAWQKPHEEQSDLSTPPAQTKHNPLCHPLLTGLREQSQQFSDLDNKLLAMMDQLRQIKAFFRVHQPTCSPTPPQLHTSTTPTLMMHKSQQPKRRTQTTFPMEQPPNISPVTIPHFNCAQYQVQI